MPDSADSLRRRMQEVRGHLATDVDHLAGATRDMTDWRVYVRRYPWVCVGLAAVAGYLLVPGRAPAKGVELLLGLAGKSKSEPTGGAKGAVAAVILGPLSRLLIDQAARTIATFLDKRKRKAAGHGMPRDHAVGNGAHHGNSPP